MEVCKNNNKQICFSFNVIKEKAVLRYDKNMPSKLKPSFYGVISNISLRQKKNNNFMLHSTTLLYAACISTHCGRKVNTNNITVQN